jgi:hypothetical protein
LTPDSHRFVRKISGRGSSVGFSLRAFVNATFASTQAKQHMSISSC